jgi:MFS family permease
MTDWKKVALIILAGVLSAFQIGKMPVSLVAFRSDLGLSLVFAGWVVSIFHLIGLIFGIVAGTVADHLGHRRVMLVSLLCIALSNVCGAIAQSGAVLLASRIGEGIGVILILVSAPTFILQFTQPKDRRLVLGIWGTWMPVGSGLMILISPLILDPFGWRGVWMVNAGALLTYATVFTFATKSVKPNKDGLGKVQVKSLWQGIRHTLTATGPLALSASAVVSSASVLTVSSFLPTFLVEDNMVDLAQAAVLTGVAVLIGAIGNIFSAWILSRGASLWAVIALGSLVLGITSFSIFAIDMSPAGRYVLCAFYFMSVGTIFSAQWGAVPIVAVSPALIATTFGFWVQGASFGMILGPPVAAKLATESSWQNVSWFVGGLALVGVLLAFRIRSAVVPVRRVAVADD